MPRLLHLEAWFPKLAAAGYKKTSERTGFPPQAGAYNCIAWAAGDPGSARWWWPAPDSYWPPWAKLREPTVECFVITFRRLGYRVCHSSRPEFAYEKVALYAIHRSYGAARPPESWRDMQGWVPTHMARQLGDGAWTSKCGPCEDITHFTLDALESYGSPSNSYGCPVVYMKRLVPIARLVSLVQWVAWKCECDPE